MKRLCGTDELLLIKNAEVWNSDGVLKNVHLVVKNGILESCSSEIPKFEAKEVDAKGKVLLPSGLDLQVHMRVPGQYHKENARTHLEAALRGGFGAVLVMPNTYPVLHSPAVLERLFAECGEDEQELGVKVLASSAVTVDQGEKELVDFRAMKEAGVVAITEDGKAVRHREHMLAALQACAELKIPFLQHAEEFDHGGALAKGSTQTQQNVPLYPELAESRLIARDLEILRECPEARYHVLHVTTRQSVELIEKAKNEGLKVTAEVTPHHLTFSSEEIPSNNTSFKMNPPLHGPEHREALRMAIKSGVIDFLTTDHAPHEIWAKDREFADSAYGTTAMEAALRVLLEMKLSGEISSGKVVDLFSKNPAEFIGLSNEFGDIAVGRPFRAVLFDAAAEPQAVEIEDLGSLSKNSIFLGHPLPGRIEGHYSASGFFAF